MKLVQFKVVIMLAALLMMVRAKPGYSETNEYDLGKLDKKPSQTYFYRILFLFGRLLTN